MATDSDLRRRQLQQPSLTSPSTTKAPSTTRSSTSKQTSTSTSTSYYVLEAFRTLAGLTLLAILSSYLLTSGRSYTYGLLSPQGHTSVLPTWAQPSTLRRYFSSPLLLTPTDLANHDGSTPSVPIYVGLNGTIYDVSKSPHIYGPGGMYGILSGKDASRSFITGCFEPGVDLVPYLDGVEEIYVPLWLSRRNDAGTEEEWEEVGAATGTTAGRSPSELIRDVQKRLGEEKVEVMREEAYAAGRQRVQATLETWKKMLQNKGYPSVGTLNPASLDNDALAKKAKDLPLCKEALKNRPSMTESLTAAVAAMVKGGKLDIGKMAKEYAAKAGAKIGDEGAEGMAGADDKAREKIKEAVQKGHAAANPHAGGHPHAHSPHGEGVPAGGNPHAQNPHAENPHTKADAHAGHRSHAANPHAVNPHANANIADLKTGKVAKHADADAAAEAVGGVPPHGGNKARRPGGGDNRRM